MWLKFQMYLSTFVAIYKRVLKGFFFVASPYNHFWWVAVEAKLFDINAMFPNFWPTIIEDQCSSILLCKCTWLQWISQEKSQIYHKAYKYWQNFLQEIGGEHIQWYWYLTLTMVTSIVETKMITIISIVITLKTANFSKVILLQRFIRYKWQFCLPTSVATKCKHKYKYKYKYKFVFLLWLPSIFQDEC